MRAVFDSSSLISLARAGIVDLVPRIPFEAVLVDQVWAEVVTAGRAGGHPDASALSAAFGRAPLVAAPASPTVDAAVLAVAAEVGTLVANDLALGRRARNLGVIWLRTADLIVFGRAVGALDAGDARRSITALRDSGRITPELADSYLEDI